MSKSPFSFEKPFRSYSSAFRREIWLEPPDFKDHLSAGDVISRAEIIEWSKPLRFQLSNEDLDRLSEALNVMRVTDLYLATTVSKSMSAREIDELNQIEELTQRTLKNIRTLSQDIPKLIAFAGQFEHNAAKLTAALLEGLFPHVMRFTIIRPPEGEKPTRFASWHNDARYLYIILNEAAKREQTVIGFQNASAPGVQFIHAALARVGVKHGKAEAVSQMFNRKKRKAAGPKKRRPRKADN